MFAAILNLDQVPSYCAYFRVPSYCAYFRVRLLCLDRAYSMHDLKFFPILGLTWSQGRSH